MRREKVALLDRPSIFSAFSGKPLFSGKANYKACFDIPEKERGEAGWPLLPFSQPGYNPKLTFQSPRRLKGYGTEEIEGVQQVLLLVQQHVRLGDVGGLVRARFFHQHLACEQIHSY